MTEPENTTLPIPQSRSTAGLCGMDCDAAFDDWYSMQRHQLSNEDVCRVIWKSSWEAAQKEWRAPLTMAEVKMVGTYAPEGVTDDDVEILVRKIEQMHGLTHNADVTGLAPAQEITK